MKEIEKLKQEFNNYKITVIENTPNVQVFLAKMPNTSSFSFQVVIASNMIAMSGDIYNLMINPGYGRGIGWLRSSINSPIYVREKMPRQFYSDREWESEDAKKALKEYLDQKTQDDPETKEKNDEILEECKYYVGIDQLFYSFCTNNGIDEPYDIYKGNISHQQIFQLAALTWFCEELDRMEFKVKEGES